MRRWLPRLSGVAALAGRSEAVVAREFDALKILGVATDALFTRASELRWLATMTPEALHAPIGPGESAVFGGARMSAGELPPRMFDASVPPRALGVTHTARLRARADMRRASRRLELGLMTRDTTQRSLATVAAMNGLWNGAPAGREQCRNGQRQEKLKIALHGTSFPGVGKLARAFGQARVARRKRRRLARDDGARRSPPTARPSQAAPGASWCEARS